MSFKRQTCSPEYATEIELTRRLIAIGFLFSGYPAEYEPNIEETLVACSLEGVPHDYRALSLLTDWWDIHSERVNADHLIRLVSEIKHPLVKKYWIACAQWKKSDPRFKKLRDMDDGKRVKLVEVGTDYLLERDGENMFFKGTSLIVAAKNIRHRPKDIMTPSQLAKIHRGYHYRLLIGPTYRADLMALLEKDPNLSAAEIARQCYSSFSTALQAKHDFELLKSS